jgi:hypothetical protein
MNLLRSGNRIGNLKYTISSRRGATKTSKKCDLYENREFGYEPLDATTITIVGKTSEVYKNQFLDWVTVTV